LSRELSHPAVTRHARLGRIPMAEHRVASGPNEGQCNRNKRDFMSQELRFRVSGRRRHVTHHLYNAKI
ncbi:MAG TPA: hypothetical protein VGK19_25160, partial [Capsulimonadaceae bacterium]